MGQVAAPLAGIRIVEMDAIGPVPLAAMLLADMGAEVVRIARPPGSGTWDDVGGAVLHRNRDVIHLDLKLPHDRDAALSLIGAADAVIEGFRPGVMERLGLGPEACLAINPRLVFARVTGWGQTGPLSPRAGHDLNYIAITGVLRAMGDPGERPPVPLNMVGDYAGGTMFGVSGILAGLLSAQATGEGRVVDIAIADAVASLSAFFLGYRANGLWHDARGANLLDGSAPFYRCYACADGEYVAVGALEPHFFAQLLKGLDIEGDRFTQMDRSCWPEMAATFAERFASASRDRWAALFERVDACVAPVLSFSEAAIYPHNVARGAYVSIDGTLQPGAAPRFSPCPDLVVRPAQTTEVGKVLSRWRNKAAA